MSRRRARAAAVTALLGGLLIAAPSAFAVEVANPNASCLGSGSAGLAPGQQDVYPPGTHAVSTHYVQTIAEALGVPYGQLVKGAAQQHGSVASCWGGVPPLP